LLVDHFLTASASRWPDKVALVCGQRRLTYREIDESANRLADALRRLGVNRGDRVATFLENSVEAVISIFGILRAGAVLVPIGPTVKSDKLAYILRDCEASALITDQHAIPAVADAVVRAPSVQVTFVGGDCVDTLLRKAGGMVVSFDSTIRERAAAPCAQPARIDLDLAAIVYTSGSSAQSKGVTLTHRNIVSAATSIGGYLANTPDDVILNVLPLSFDYGLYQVFLAFRAGARLILEPSFIYTAVLLDRLVQERVTALPIVPMLAVFLLKYDLSAYEMSLRYITNTGGALPPAHIAALRQRFPQTRIFSMYGLTECKRVSFLPPEEIDERPTSVGKPMENVEVFIAGEDGVLRSSGVGELVIRGSNVMQGYWRAPLESSRALKPGPLPGQSVLYTGDLFHIDEDGYMYFQSRLDDVIKSRGQRVSPKEVENAIYELPGIIAVSVVGVPDVTQGNFIKAVAYLDEGVTLSEKDIIRHCAQRLEDFMVPQVVEFVRHAPTTDSGKLHRRLMASPAGDNQVQAPA
jgi:long-chain acyl-CoA synthetase